MALARIDDIYSGIFDSVNYEVVVLEDGTTAKIWDRAKNARFFADLILGITTSGLNSFYTDCFKIIPGDGLSVIRLPGGAWLDGYFLDLKPPLTTTITEVNQVYYYTVRCMSDVENRCMYEGLLMNPDESTIPERTENNFELILAKIEVPAGTTQITADMITDLRYNKDYCGLATVNMNPSNLILTADDVTDTDTHMIPIKTGDGNKPLFNDGLYKDTSNLWYGDYQFIPNGDVTNICCTGTESLGPLFIPTSSFGKSNSSSLPNMIESLNSVENTTYDEIGGMVVIRGHVVYVYGTTFNEEMRDIDIKVDIKLACSSYVLTSEISLYNLDTDAVIEGTTQTASLPANQQPTIFTYTYHYDSYTDLPTHNIGLKVTYDTKNTYAKMRFYGSNIQINSTRDVVGRVIGQLTRTGIVTTPTGEENVQATLMSLQAQIDALSNSDSMDTTMYTQAILDNTQDIMLLQEGIIR